MQRNNISCAAVWTSWSTPSTSLQFSSLLLAAPLRSQKPRKPKSQTTLSPKRSGLPSPWSAQSKTGHLGLCGYTAESHTPTPQPAREPGRPCLGLFWPHQLAAWVASLSLQAELSTKVSGTSHHGSGPVPCSCGFWWRHSLLLMDWGSLCKAIKTPYPLTWRRTQ